MFNKESGLVKTWVTLIKNELYTADDVPKLSNLREVVAAVLAEEGGEK